MSIFFISEDKTVWNPSNGVAKAYLGITRIIETYFDAHSGFSDITSDEVQIDKLALETFIEDYASQHTIFQELAKGHYLVTRVLCDRLGIRTGLDPNELERLAKRMPT